LGLITAGWWNKPHTVDLVGESPTADIIGEVTGSREAGDAGSSSRNGNDEGGEADHFGGRHNHKPLTE